jgi:hypothetical protein
MQIVAIRSEGRDPFGVFATVSPASTHRQI